MYVCMSFVGDITSCCIPAYCCGLAIGKPSLGKTGNGTSSYHAYLFICREVPQASTGFAPFELLYGRLVCRTLNLVQEAWGQDTRCSESVISYVLSMQEKLAKKTELVRENLSQAQSNQKKWYEQNARRS